MWAFFELKYQSVHLPTLNKYMEYFFVFEIKKVLLIELLENFSCVFP